MTARLVPAQLKTDSTRKIRLADFGTGSHDLQREHMEWLDDSIKELRGRDHFWITIVGYASKLRPRGSTSSDNSRDYNVQLSYERANAVARYLGIKDARTLQRTKEFRAAGNADYKAPPDDNSPIQRAVEVHITHLVVPPPPPEDVEPAPEKPPLPGGARCSLWEVAVPIGYTQSVLPGAVVAVNVVVFRCRETGVTHKYVSPAVGGGASWSGPKLSKKVLDKIKEILGNSGYSGMTFKPATALTPFNFRDLENASCELKQAVVGAVKSKSNATLSLRAQVWYRTPNGKQHFASRQLLEDTPVGGDNDLAWGIGFSLVGGPLFRID